MIEYLGVDPSAAAPGRGDDQGHPEAKPDRRFPVKFFGEPVAFPLLFKGYKLHARVESLRYLAGTRFVRMGGGKKGGTAI